jgi:hypothetical protein
VVATKSEWRKPVELARERGVSLSTVWRWAGKNLLEVERLAPRIGVRMRVRGDDEVRRHTEPMVQNEYGELVPSRPAAWTARVVSRPRP